MLGPYSRQFYSIRTRVVIPFFAKAYVLYLPIVMMTAAGGIGQVWLREGFVSVLGQPGHCGVVRTESSCFHPAGM